MKLSYDTIIHMTTISVPLPSNLLDQLTQLVKSGKAANKAAAMRMALEKYLEDQAVQEVLDARREPALYGDLDELAKKL